MVSEYVTDFTELIADAHPSGDMLLSVSSEAQNPTIAGVSRVTLGERSALMSIPDDAPEKVKVTLNEIASSAYESVSDHVVEKFGEEAKLFSQDDKIDRMFLIEVDFVTSLFDALRIQRIHQLRKRTLTTGKLPDFIGITLTGANNLRAKYGEDSKEYKAGVLITTKVLKQITDAFATMYEKGVAEIISVGPETALEGQVPNLVKRLASINMGCPQAVSDCQTAFNNCSNHGVCTNFVNPRNRNETCFFCSCFKNNTDDSGTVLLNKNRRKVIWAGPSCAAQDISSQFNILLWTIIAFVIAIIFVIGLMYSIGEEAASSGASGVAKRRKQD
ncbi:hypothetical protein BC829DRAFT_160085 [Chytridium lagenaria]|nr:hypothetical protein BC829DRAFT_160085 [Chytridium lagenaria]